MKSRQAKEDDGKKEFRLVRIKNPEGVPAAAAAVGAAASGEEAKGGARELAHGHWACGVVRATAHRPK